MVDFKFLFALFCSGVLLLCYGNDALLVFKNKMLRMGVAILIAIVTAISWSIILCGNLNSSVLYSVCFILSTAVFSFFNLILLWNDKMQKNPEDKQPKEVKYTLNTLLGQHGVVDNVLDGNHCLGHLLDDAKSNILVTIDAEKPVQQNCHFIVSCISEKGEIHAKMTD